MLEKVKIDGIDGKNLTEFEWYQIDDTIKSYLKIQIQSVLYSEQIEYRTELQF